MRTSVRLPPAPPWPAAFFLGPAHRIVHGNAAFLAAFGASCVGQPAREALVELPPAAFELMDRVLGGGHPLACRLSLEGGEARLVVAPRRDPETGQTYGVAAHLRPAEEAGGSPERHTRPRPA
jgi:hypothetical protein